MNYKEIVNDPDLVKLLDCDEIKEILKCVRKIFEKEKALIEPNSDKFIFVGDTHGDFETTTSIVKNFFEDNCVVFLGDYIDREPTEWGSIYNIVYLFILKFCFPDKIYLLKGNHECNYIIPCFPYEFEYELIERYGKNTLHSDFVDVFKEMPLMFFAKRIFAAHGGILKDADINLLRKIDKNDISAIEYLAWSDPVISNTCRGCGYPFDEDDLTKFLDKINAKIFLRGHDYNTLGFSIYNNRCFTIFSSRRYKDMGNKGILVAKVEKDVDSIDDINVYDFSTGEWRNYDIRRL